MTIDIKDITEKLAARWSDFETKPKTSAVSTELACKVVKAMQCLADRTHAGDVSEEISIIMHDVKYYFTLQHTSANTVKLSVNPRDYALSVMVALNIKRDYIAESIRQLGFTNVEVPPIDKDNPGSNLVTCIITL